MKAAWLPRATARPAVLTARALAVTALLAGTISCSPGGDSTGASAGSSAAGDSSAADGSATAVEAAQGPFGPACDIFPVDGPGSVAALATTPVGGAVSSVPELSVLTQAVLAANFVDVVNTRADVTVLAPSNSAFAALGPDALPALLADVPRLTAVLTHHVIPGRLTPDQLVGQHTTLNGDSITISGPASAPTVTAEQTVAAAAPATLVCGDVPTANATVYVVDQVLAPTAG